MPIYTECECDIQKLFRGEGHDKWCKENPDNVTEKVESISRDTYGWANPYETLVVGDDSEDGDYVWGGTKWIRKEEDTDVVDSVTFEIK